MNSYNLPLPSPSTPWDSHRGRGSLFCCHTCFPAPSVDDTCCLYTPGKNHGSSSPALPHPYNAQAMAQRGRKTHYLKNKQNKLQFCPGARSCLVLSPHQTFNATFASFTVVLNIKHSAARNRCFYNLVNIYSLYLSFQMITKYFLTLPEPHFVPGGTRSGSCSAGTFR